MESENYKKHIRPYSKSQSLRVDEEMYKNLELIRCLNSNDFASPTTSDIVRTLLSDYVMKIHVDAESDPVKSAKLKKLGLIIAENLDEENSKK